MKRLFLACFGGMILLFTPVGCQLLSQSQDGLKDEDGLQPWNDQEQDNNDDDTDVSVTDPQNHYKEVCDGRDNDGDGLTDEGTDGEVCETQDGQEGAIACIGGIPRCRVCEPGSVRQASCGCDIERQDVCGEDGVWRKGACDPCEDPEPMPCGFCGTVNSSGVCEHPGECQPGDVMYRRCDSCPQSSGCGPSTCVGEKWECTDGCVWEKTEDCEIRPSECERDAKLIQPCGQCGIQIYECDGCFWNRSNCREQGQCFPGASRPIPCFDKGCREGWGATQSCNANCEWNISQCQGCDPGRHVEKVNCVFNHPRCGQRDLQYDCVITQDATECLPGVASKTNFVYLSDCPPIDCYPGQVQSAPCTLDSGEGGEMTRKCNSSCEWPENWSPCTATTSSCVPGTQKVENTPCGCGISYTTTSTCQADGMGWDVEVTGREDCPECEQGDSYNQSCMVDGRCGTSTTSCDENCEWQESECKPRANSCVAGSTETRSCNSMCGAGHGTYTCIGCNWYLTGECVPDGSVDCTPGETRTVQCNPDGCPQRTDACSDSCHWVEGDCPACG